MAYGSIICDLCTEILIYDSYWQITSKDFFKAVRLTEGFFSNDHKNCPLSVLWRCPFYREFHYSKSYTKTIGECEKCPFYGGVRLTEVFVSRELTVTVFIETFQLTMRFHSFHVVKRKFHIFQCYIKTIKTRNKSCKALDRNSTVHCN